MIDKIKTIIALAIVTASLFVYYSQEEVSLLFRVLGVVAAVIVAFLISATTEKGSAAIAFIRSAIIEMKKVVWPSKKETTQTTLTVGVMVVIVGIILWTFDQIIGWGVRLLTGQG
ncbi:MAG: preprotein translocase subunit SecE [gamma proteobacterium symbiont of Taylorina sp.]|nr:preprotein translocase subunit SecE [gamma proteobacterium symbiont of Taylorina sp.]